MLSISVVAQIIIFEKTHLGLFWLLKYKLNLIVYLVPQYTGSNYQYHDS